MENCENSYFNFFDQSDFSNLLEKMSDWKFTKRGVLIHKDTLEPISPALFKKKDQMEMVYNYVISHIQKKLQAIGLKKVMIPFNKPEEEQIPVFMSTDFTSNTEKVLVFVPTKGDVQYYMNI
jgi:hypothetical protein